MRWRIDQKTPAGQTALLGVFLAFALVIGLIERMIPLPLSIPGFRLGLGNVAVLLAMYLFPLSRALLLTVLKCLMTAVFSGNPSMLFYSLGGSLLSFLAMALCVSLTRDRMSPVGVSVVGAAFHNTGQILVACLLFRSAFALVYLPGLLLVGVLTGTLTGLLVRRLRAYFTAAFTRR